MTGWLALVTSLMVVACCAVGLTVVSEDVISGNGLELQDAANLRFFTNHRSPPLVAGAKLVTQFGSGPILLLLAVAVGALLWWRGARIAVALAPAVALSIAAMVATLAKALVDRGRPPLALHLVPEMSPSFPSGHATDSAAVYLSIGVIVAAVLFRRPFARLVSIGLSGLLVLTIGLSRLVLGVHWPTDVLAGWGLGLMVSLVVTTTILLMPSARTGARDRAGRFKKPQWQREPRPSVRQRSAHSVAALR